MRQLGKDERLGIYDALQHGQSVSQIYRATEHNRQTIRHIRDSSETSSPLSSARHSHIDPYHQYIRERVLAGRLH